ncbi:accessory gene regulator B family protein [Ruthenibacterium lactatiformans]|uniref:accessory gene regulator B family protein n=1 Tax=Ruthenibacterium lactatiformans TaxID=1550024 RepID=UPI003B97D5F3
MYTLQTRISMFLSTAGMMLLGCLVATPYQVICFLAGILSLRRRLGGYHAKTPLRCLFLSVSVSILCLGIVKKLIQYSLSILIWILFISLSFAVFNSSPYSHPNCPLTPDELAVSWIKAKHILIWNLFLILSLQIFFAHSYCALYCEMGIIAAAISFFVSKFKEVKSS